MMNLYNIVRITLFLTAALLLAACPNDNNSGAGVSYSGKTTPVDITRDNGTQVGNMPVDNTDSETFNSPVRALTGNAKGSDKGLSSAKRSLQKVLAVAGSFYIPNGGGGYLTRQIQSNSESQDCADDGSFTISASYDDVTLDGDITMSFSNCTADGVAINGSFGMETSGVTTPQSSVSLSFNDLTVVGEDAEGKVDLGMDGEFVTTLDENAQVMTFTINFVAADNVTGEQAKMENFVIKGTTTYQLSTTVEDVDALTDAEYVSAMDTLDNVEISGRIYESNVGYVDIETETPLRASGDVFTDGGPLVVIGQNNESVKLTPLSSSEYQIDIDEDGDGVFETTEVVNW